MLKKAFAVTTLLGVLFEVIEQASQGKGVVASGFGLVGLFVCIWIWDVFKEVGKEKIDRWDRRLYRVLRQTHVAHRSLTVPPTADLANVVRNVASAVRNYCEHRYPVNRGFRTTLRLDEPQKVEVCCSGWCRLRLEVESFLPSDIRLRMFRRAPRLVIWTALIGVVFGALVFTSWLAGFADNIEAHELEKNTHDLALMIAIFGVVTISLLYIIVRFSAGRWFPRSSIGSIGCESQPDPF